MYFATVNITIHTIYMVAINLLFNLSIRCIKIKQNSLYIIHYTHMIICSFETFGSKIDTFAPSSNKYFAT